MSKTGIIIQARLNSERLPCKVMLGLGGDTVLGKVILAAKNVVDCPIVVAIPDHPSNDILESTVKLNNVDVYRGSSENVLDRFNKCKKQFDFDNIIRLTADNPCIDPQVILAMLDSFLEKKLEYLHNIRQSGFPMGVCCEIISNKAFEFALDNSKTKFEQEHVTPAIYIKGKHLKIDTFKSDNDLSQLRLTIDNLEDYVTVYNLFADIGMPNTPMDIKSISEYFASFPNKIFNSNITQKSIYE